MPNPPQKRKVTGIALLALLCLALPSATAQEKQNVPLVLDLRIDGEIEPVLATYIEEGLAEAARRYATLVLITMNYAPPSRLMRPFLAPLSGHMEGLIEKVLRDFKASVESRPMGVQGAIRSDSEKIGPGTVMTDLPRTGTYGDEPRKIETRISGSSAPTGFPAPPETKR